MPRSETFTHPWAGFELAPEGCLFEQQVELEGEMGIAYERSLKFTKRTHVHDRTLLVLPRSGTTMRITTQQPRRAHDVSSSEFIVVPAQLPHADHWVTEVYDTFALFPDRSLVERCAQKMGAPTGCFDVVGVYSRSGWLEVLVSEYFVERVPRSESRRPRAAPLEELIVMEVLRLMLPPPSVPARRSGARAGPTTLVARALRHLEANLFAPFDLASVCRVVGASRSVLLRQFRNELQTTPRAYLLGRRLDESRRLLASGRHPVGEVAQLVGYDSFSAFSEAFKRRFRVSPSEARRR